MLTVPRASFRLTRKPQIMGTTVKTSSPMRSGAMKAKNVRVVAHSRRRLPPVLGAGTAFATPLCVLMVPSPRPSSLSLGYGRSALAPPLQPDHPWPCTLFELGVDRLLRLGGGLMHEGRQVVARLHGGGRHVAKRRAGAGVAVEDGHVVRVLLEYLHCDLGLALLQQGSGAHSGPARRDVDAIGGVEVDLILGILDPQPPHVVQRYLEVVALAVDI